MREKYTLCVNEWNVYYLISGNRDFWHRVFTLGNNEMEFEDLTDFGLSQQGLTRCVYSNFLIQGEINQSLK